jgi:hypothetical protein
MPPLSHSRQPEEETRSSEGRSAIHAAWSRSSDKVCAHVSLGRFALVKSSGALCTQWLRESFKVEAS